MHLPAVQFPASLPSSPAAVQAAVGALSGAADAIAHLPSSIQQQMQLLQLQLQQPITTSNSTFEPHFGTKMLTALLQQVLHSFQDVLDASTAQLSAAAAASPINPASVSSSAIAVNDAVTAYFRTVLAFWQVLAAAAVHALPPGVNQTLSESWDTLQQQTTIATAVLQQQSIAATASLHQVHEHLVHMQLVLQQLPQRGFAGHSFLELSVVVAGTLVAIAASVPPEGAVSGGEDIIRDELTHEYNDAEVAAYFTRRPVLVAQRSLHIAAELTAFGASLFSDALSNKLQINQAQRAVQLRGVIERLGPAWVKVAQALSTRIDLLPPEYYKQVQLLQDRVPPFPCEQAKEVISNAFGRPVDEVFSYMSPKPVAAASLGQVYKGRLRPELGVGDVAVKVQRPDVLQQVCLDLHLMRRVAATISALPEVRIDWAALIDSWAVRFLHEMDYTREAANAKLFRQQMADAGVIGIVTADVLDDLSNDVVLTTTWVDGEKLSESRASDVRELCNTLLSAYLIQLLDTGLLHADPHPGNLLRTVDGRICVLDFGLMTEVTPEQRIALVEYIAHLTIQDWENVARDLQTLGFIPPEVGDPVALGIAGPLGRILVQLSGGGGATKLNIDAVMSELETLGKQYPFSIPPFFALILRAFSVIEGIALAVDPDYSIVQECFPYIARRLLADDDPRVHKALRDVLYGGRHRLDVDRLIRLADAFTAYTTDGLATQPQQVPQQQQSALATAYYSRSTQLAIAAPAGSPANPSSPQPILNPAAKDALLVIFSKQGSYVQQLLVDELVVAADALSREAASEVLRLLLGSAPAVLALSGLEALGPLRPLVLPFPTPLELLDRLAPAVALTEEDKEALGVVRGIFNLVTRLQTGSNIISSSGSASEIYYSTGAANNVSNAGSGIMFSSTAEGRRVFDPAVFRGQLPSNTAAAAAAEAVSDAIRVVIELRPLLPELWPGLMHTAELFVRAFVSRVSARLVESLAHGGAAEQEREQAMAALGFMPLDAMAVAPSKFGGVSSGSGSANQFGFSGLRRQKLQPGNPWPTMPSSNFMQPNIVDVDMPGAVSLNAGSGAGSTIKQQLPTITTGQLVIGVMAAPILAVFTPLALLSEMHRKQQRS
eukprot:GHRR01002863.1.p1 GENE.GHRR01002863.1~~GHRR01002863.1.p1  ORF type:complete len:1118 (+),score=442.23 GHRR01002863.1:702-4055(+)